MKKYGLKNNCVWLGLATMLYSFDKEESHKMIHTFDNDDHHKDFNWMYIMRLSNAAKKEKQMIPIQIFL